MMKKRLIFASFMLVFALVAVVASTYAWFTMQTEVEATSLDLNVASEESLFIRAEDEDYGQNVTIKNTETVNLTTVTLNEDLTFLKSQYNKTEDKYYVDAATTENVDYLMYKLYFKTDITGKKIVLKTQNSTFTSNQDNVERFVRVGFKVNDVMKVLEPAVEGSTGGFGEGDFFDPEKNPSYDQFKHLLTDGTITCPYEELLHNTTDDLVLVNSTVANEEVEVEVYVWLEGWDGDSLNVKPNTTLKTYLKFELVD